MPLVLRSLLFVTLAVALARPQSVLGRERRATRGVAIVVALDASSSMTARDFPGPQGLLTRREAARSTLERFVAARPDDLIGLVSFARLPDSSCAPTLDHDFVIETAAALGTTTPDQDGTNLGDALVWALRDVQGTGSPRRVIVLLTDGRNEPGLAEALEPEAAATLVRQQGVVLHTIAIGARAEQTSAVEGMTSGPDHERLRRLAALGGGDFFEAANSQALERVFEQIDRLERRAIQGTIRLRYREHFGPWALAALGLLVTDRLLNAGRFRRLPG